MKPAIALVAVLIAATPALSAVGLDITKPPANPVPSYTGPVQDPDSASGQWFKDLDTGGEDARSHEFYDNVSTFGGGFAGAFSILGVVKNVQSSGGGISGFTIEATITNDMPGNGPWRDGTNSHEEWRPGSAYQYEGPMLDVMLTAEFAIDLAARNAWRDAGGSFTDPYRLTASELRPTNHDALGWYCYTPDNPDPNKTPRGDYLVPTWEFGDIAPGESVSRDLLFTSNIIVEDPLFTFLLGAEASQADVLANRTTSLKISTWMEDLANDPGTPYPLDDAGIDSPLRNSNASVFFNVPEPTTLLLLTPAGIALLRKRRRA